MSAKKAGPRLAVVILAADDGATLGSQRPKALHNVCGKPLLGHVIAAASGVVDAQDIFVVAEDQAERLCNAVAGAGVQLIEPTGNFLQSVQEALAAYEQALVLPVDVPLVGSETLEQLSRFHQKEEAALTILEGSPAPSSSRAAYAQIYAIRIDALRASPPTSTLSGAFDLADLSAAFQKSGQRIATLQAEDATQLQRVRTIADLVALDIQMRRSITDRLMASGVTIYQPETCVIDSDVEVEPDAILEPFVQLLGKTRIGAETRIRSYSVIENCTVGRRGIIRQSCVLADSTIADGADIGPFARMRPGCQIGEDVHIGNFVEVKNSKLHKGVKAGHLAYLGDSEIGARTNIGAGVITCNYDGVKKHKTEIGEGAFIGSDSTLVAPISIHDGAYIGAGSCITKEVPAGALAVGRARQVTKEGWAAARRERLNQEKSHT